MTEPIGEQTPQSKPEALKTFLSSKGINLDIPERFKKPVTEKQPIDQLTGLPVLDNDSRTFTANELSQCLKDGKNWACVYSDLDNLKTANTKHGRDFGDVAIKYGAAKILNTVVGSGISDSAEIIATRQTGAADETVIWLFGLTNEETQKLKEKIAIADERLEVVEPKYILSMSSALLTSSDPRVTKKCEETKEWLEQDETRIAYDFFNQIRDIADHDTALLKMAKDHISLTPQELLTNKLPELYKLITENYGDRRITSVVLEDIMKLAGLKASIETLKKLFPNPEELKQKYRELGIDEESLSKAKTIEDLTKVFDSIFTGRIVE